MSAIEEIASCCKELRLSCNITENVKKIEEADKELFLLDKLSSNNIIGTEGIR